MARFSSQLWLGPLGVVIALACNTDGAGPPPAGAGFAVAYGIWTPGPGDTCPVDVHNQFNVVGPDGKIYPTWHPSTDPTTGCSFGHDHGKDPRDSRLYQEVGPIPFGYANEQLDAWDPTGKRHEDHVGHKIEWQNEAEMRFPQGVASNMFEVKCDVLTKLHQGTHSKDAFTNNLHELVYHIKCSDRTEMHVTLMSAIGTPGEFEDSCDRDDVVVGPATPANSPDGGGVRIIPTRECIEREILVPAGTNSDFGVLRESWETSNTIRLEDGRSIAHFNPYYQVRFPSRYYDPAVVGLVGRPMDLCYEITPAGTQANGRTCSQATDDGASTGIPYTDPRSPFNGADRDVDINSNDIRNSGGQEVWFTDPFGRHGRPAEFAGSIRQWIASIDNDRGVDISGPNLGDNYGQGGVHAPN